MPQRYPVRGPTQQPSGGQNGIVHILVKLLQTVDCLRTALSQGCGLGQFHADGLSSQARICCERTTEFSGVLTLENTMNGH